MARDWTKPPPDAIFTLRVPVEYASLHAAVCSIPFTRVEMLTPPSVWYQGRTSMFVNIAFSSGISGLHYFAAHERRFFSNCHHGGSGFASRDR